MKNIYRNFQRKKRVVICGFFVASVGLFLSSFFLRNAHEWWSNLFMGIGASCLASAMFAIVTSFPDKYRKLKEEMDEKYAIIHSRWEAINIARLNFKEYLKAENYDRALGYLWYMHEKCGALRSQFVEAQNYQHILKKDKSIDDYGIEFETIEKQLYALCEEIEVDGDAFAAKNPRREEFIQRMTEIIDRFYKNYDNIYGMQLGEAAEMERVKFKNRY